MNETLQTEGLTIMQHGEAVWDVSKAIISGNFEGMKLPDNFIEHHRYLINNTVSFKDFKQYNIYHDCGKPFVLEFDEEGRRHFPNHANESKNVYSALYGDGTVSELIGLDMLMHTGTAQEIENSGLSKKVLFTLIVTAFAEIHANAKMFGGIESTSFKIKYKKLCKRLNLVLRMFPNTEIYDHKYSYVIVRNDLPNNQKAVQGTHSSIEYFRHNEVENHPSVIYILVKDEKKLRKVMNQILDLGIDFAIFREPMQPYDDSITSICTEPISGDDRNFFKKFQLLK